MDSAHFQWPNHALSASHSWNPVEGGSAFLRTMPETDDELRHDSRWPAFFPSAICFATTHDGPNVALERLVGASIVNRFPYVLAFSLCRTNLSARHHARRNFMVALERSGNVAVQFLVPGPALDRVLCACTDVPESRTGSRVAYTGLPSRRAVTHDAPVFEDAYMVYEGRLASPSRDFEHSAIYETPWIDVGSHRVYFVEIHAIQLRDDIAEGRCRIHWQSLPDWRSRAPVTRFDVAGSPSGKPSPRPSPYKGEGVIRIGSKASTPSSGFVKSYTPHYIFPSLQNRAFESDEQANGMAVKRLPTLARDQIERDNDRARWPCFFPCSAGMITTWHEDGVANLMPCGSTSVVSRHPLVIAPCVSYAAINDRYAPRATLDAIRRTGRFGCGVPFVHETVVGAIRYAGNISVREDREKVLHAGLEVREGLGSPLLPELPIHFDCQVVGEVRLGTHVMFLGQVSRIRVRSDVTPDNPIGWRPWATLQTATNNGAIQDYQGPKVPVAQHT